MRVKVINTGTLLGAMIGGYSGFPLSGVHFGVYAIIPLGTPSYVSSKDRIVAGERSSWGDRPCRHMKLQGDLTLLPSVTCSRVVEQMVTADSWSPASSTQTKYTYYQNDGLTWHVVGPPAVGSLVPYRQDFPDMVGTGGNLGYKRSEIYVEIKVSGNIFERIVHYVTTTPAGAKVTYHNSKSYEIDFAGRRYRDKNSSYWQGFSSLRSASFDASSFVLPTLWSDYERIYQQLDYQFLPAPESMILGDLVRRCANDAQVVQTNSIELTRDLHELTSTLKNVYSLTKGKIGPKKIAEAYLSYKYGVRLTYQDLRLIGKTIEQQLEKQRLAYSKVHASTVTKRNPVQGSVVGNRVTKYTYTIHYRPYSSDWRRAVQLAQDSGLFPSLQNSWDLVPLSFVVDWFTQLSDRISMYDADTYWSTYDILGCCSSLKQTFLDVTSMFSSSRWTLVGQVDLLYYSRAPHSFALPASYFENSPREFRNYAEATALIVANRRK